MKVTSTITDRHSEDDFSKRLQILADSGAGVIHVRSQEIVRSILATRKAVLVDGNQYKEWDIANGMRTFQVNDMFRMDVEGDGNVDIHDCISKPMEAIQENVDKDYLTFFAFVNAQYFLENNPITTHFMQQYCHILAASTIRVLLITPDMPLPEELSGSIVTLPFDTPSHAELRQYLDAVLESVEDNYFELDEEEKDRICFAGAGMSRENFEMYVSLSIVDTVSGPEETANYEDILSGLNEGKTEIVNKNDILELNHPESMDDVGGMENLKEWVYKRSACFTDEAVEFGIDPPKGMVFVGIPGTGKSLAAKAISQVLGVPLVRLDFGRVFNSFVGRSEERMRVALKMVESMSPCVLFCDEVDKGLGGIGGSGDSGTSSRVLGSFLTWLQENKTPVFTMVTANNITGLPPELLRRGRFDAIFAAGLPNEAERMEILKIHLRKRGYDLAKFPAKDKNNVMVLSAGYVGAEIEAAVQDGLIDAFAAEEKFSLRHVGEALERMVPLSKAHNALIQEMTLWMQNNATPASKSGSQKAEGKNKVTQLSSRRTRVRVTDKTED